jgi:hypothetical protein
MQNNYEQMTLGDIYSNVAHYFEEEKPRFFQLMEQYIEFNEDGTPLCPADSSLPLLYMGVCKGKNRSARLKWVCPKSIPIGTSGKCTCPHPCF